MGKKYKIGIVGFGAAGRHIVPGIDSLPEAELVAVTDVRTDDLNKAKEKLGIDIFTEVEEMCKQTDVDIVWVASPNHLHALHTTIAANYGKHIICEKPMTISLQEADQMIEAIEKNGVKYVQGHSRLFQNSIRKMGEIIHSGQLGRVFQINSHMYNDWLCRPRLESEVDSSKGGNTVLRQGPHTMDIVRFLGGGLIRSVKANVGRWMKGFDTEGDYSAFVEFENGTTALASFNGYGYFNSAEFTWNIGEVGRLYQENEFVSPIAIPKGPIGEAKYQLPQYEIDAIRSEARHSLYHDYFGVTVVSCERGVLRQSKEGIFIYSESGREEIKVNPSPVHNGELLELIDSLENDRTPFPDMYWGKATIEVCLGMLQSAKERREIVMHHQVAAPYKLKQL